MPRAPATTLGVTCPSSMLTFLNLPQRI